MIDKVRVKETAERVFAEHKLFFTFSMFGSSGTYFFYSLFDSHPQIYNIPGEFHRWPISPKDFNSIPPESHIRKILVGNKRFFNPANDSNPNNTLNKLGDNRDQAIAINKTDFELYLNQILTLVDFNLRNFYLAVSMAYNFSLNRIPDANCFFAHAHDFPRAMEIRREIGDCQLIGVVRHPLNVYKSYCKRKFNERMDFSRHKINRNYLPYYQPSNIGTFKKLHELLDEIGEEIKVVSIEELHANPESSMRKVALALGVKYDQNLVQSTMGGLKWWGSHYTRLYGFSAILHKKVHCREIGMGDAIAMLKCTLNYQKHLGYTRQHKIGILKNLRSKFAGIYYLINRTELLLAVLKQNKNFNDQKNNLFCWAKDLYNFFKLRFLFENEVINDLARQDSKADYSNLKLMNPIGKGNIDIPDYL